MLYKKGLPTDESRHAEFMAACSTGDVFTVNRLTADKVRKPVDPIASKICVDPEIITKYSIDTSVDVAETQFVLDLVPLRDQALSSVTEDFPLGFLDLSWFLQSVEVDSRATGQNFMADATNWQNIQDGNLPLETITASGKTPIITGRDLATYVHDDDPMEQWTRVAGTLLGLGLEPKAPDCIMACEGSRFTCFGYPAIAGILGNVLYRAGLVSFAGKWTHFVARPEEAAPALGLGYLPQCYPEGSPGHPARGAMHSFAAYSLSYVILQLFDNEYILPSGNTVKYEVELFRDNIGYGRVWAGVHYNKDHTEAKVRAEAIAQKVLMGYDISIT